MSAGNINETSDELNLRIWEEKKNTFWNDTHNRQYVFEITKCSGYSTLVPMFKHHGISQLYSIINDVFQINGHYSFQLYVLHHETKERMLLPRIHSKTAKDFLLSEENVPYFKPIYPLPAPVIYRIYLDDGHCHKDHATNDDNNGACFVHN